MLAASKATRVPCSFTAAMALALSVSVPRPFMTMLAPSLASACAMPSPMPDVEPVTTAVLPWSAIAVLFERCLGHTSCRKAAVLPILWERSSRGAPSVDRAPTMRCSWHGVPQRLGDEPMTPEAKLAAMGLRLPNVPRPVGSYLPYKLSGDMLYLSGQGPMRADGSFATGKVGRDVGVDEAYEHAKLVGLGLLAAAKVAAGELSRIEVIKVLGMVNAVPEFTEQPKVINGCSDLFIAVLGERGRHARSAVGMGSLPLAITVEIEAVMRIHGSARCPQRGGDLALGATRAPRDAPSKNHGLRQIPLLEVQDLASQLPPRAVAQLQRPGDVGTLLVGGGGAQVHSQVLACLHGNGRQRGEIELLPMRARCERSGGELYARHELGRPPERQAVDIGGPPHAPMGLARACGLVAAIERDFVPRRGCCPGSQQIARLEPAHVDVVEAHGFGWR